MVLINKKAMTPLGCSPELKIACGRIIAMHYVSVTTVKINWNKHLGPVVQSVVSLTSSLRVILLTVLADSIYNFLKFFAEKM